ncbi:hypothetical protein [Arcicella lustrica]|uniref:Uncharacterized protein n=1 Tax=Arcicella lustrica TaxID=2984196 RepID=A0ABU5SDK0_9BACT|nr:hypothetical protein [Arcicella sp. DC25W]MEA5425371.1 hypothetical protein [Arcicella sp. DC25W]
MENTQNTATTTEETNKEKIQNKAFSILDFFIGALLFGLFIGVVVVFANGTINLLSRWSPSLKKKQKEDKS